ncbi:MAG: thiol peroxidase [Candidatus Omnitrophica bacterium]|nr:thiol peroxidase [Candidatus Omnitrophota bacterium]
MEKVKIKGDVFTLVGISPDVIAPDFKVVSNDLKEVNFYDSFKGKIKVITSFPSLDTPVCDLQVKEFNKIASGLSKEVSVIGISMDLPFAQKRFCEMNEIKNVSVFSDYRFYSFALNWGLLIKELGIIARSVFIVDKKNYIRYYEIVEETTNHPNYEKAIEGLKSVIKQPESSEWEKINCCSWQEKEGLFTKVFEIKDELSLKYLLEIFVIIRQERKFNFNIEIQEKKVIITVPSTKFNVDMGALFDSIKI